MRPEQETGQGSSALLGECRAAFDWWERFSQSRFGLAVMGAWALAEAMVWPVIPDAILVPLATGARRTFPRVWLAAVLGSAIGGIVLYAFALWAPDAALGMVSKLPGGHEEKVEQAADLLAERGPAAYWVQPWTGVPFKVFAVVGAGLRMDFWQSMAISITARALRMAVNGGVAALLAWPLRGFLRDFSLYLAAAYVLLFGYGWWVTQM